MKYSNKFMVFVLSVLFGYGVDTSAYTYTIANMTDRDIKVQFHYAFGTLGKKNNWIKAYDTRTFKFGGWEIGLCLTKIIATSFDGRKNHWIKLPVSLKVIDRQLFNGTKNVIKKFGGAVRKMGKAAALAGPEGVAVTGAINGLTRIVDAAVETWAISFCRSRDFIFILDYDRRTKLNRVYGLMPPD